MQDLKFAESLADVDSLLSGELGLSIKRQFTIHAREPWVLRWAVKSKLERHLYELESPLNMGLLMLRYR